MWTPTIPEQFEMLQEQAERLSEEKRKLEDRETDIHEKMGKLEDEWLKTHSCSCGLVGARCQHASS